MLAFLLASALASEDVAISVHLHEVVHTLRAETPADLSPDARRRRLGLLDALEGYAVAGDFPEHPPGPAPRRVVVPPRAFVGADTLRAPVFVDDEGTHCAVGFLMALDAPALVDRVVQTANDAWVPDLKVPGVREWAAQNGFTVEELAWIQPSYDLWAGACPAEGPPYEPVAVSDEGGFIAGAEVCPGVLVQVVWPPGGSPWCADTCDDLVTWFQVYNPGEGPVSFDVAEVGETPGVQVSLQAKGTTMVGPFSSLTVELTPTSCEGDPVLLTMAVDFGNGGSICVLGCDDVDGCDRLPPAYLEPVGDAGVTDGCGCAQGGTAGWLVWPLMGLWMPRRRRRAG